MVTEKEEEKDEGNDPGLQFELQLTKILAVPSTFAVLRSTVATKAYEAWTDLMIKTGHMEAPPTFSLDELDPTPSDITKRALELARQLVEPCIVNHMIRTYYFGMAINIWKGTIRIDQQGGVDNDQLFDREGFWVACILHDVGLGESLTPPHFPHPRFVPPKDRPIATTFFEGRGARRAHEFCCQELQPPMDAHRAWVIHEAIALHTSTTLHGDDSRNASKGLQWASMIFDGAATDLIGMKLGKISPTTLSAILTKHPKLDLHTLFPRKLWTEWKQRPLCIIAKSASLGLLEQIEKSESLFEKYIET